MRQLRRMHEPNRHHNRHHHHHHQPDPILSSFQWSRPSPKEESHVKYNAGYVQETLFFHIRNAV